MAQRLPPSDGAGGRGLEQTIAQARIPPQADVGVRPVCAHRRGAGTSAPAPAGNGGLAGGARGVCIARSLMFRRCNWRSNTWQKPPQLDASGPALDLLAEELRLAQNAPMRITGEFSSDDLLGVIFPASASENDGLRSVSRVNGACAQAPIRITSLVYECRHPPDQTGRSRADQRHRPGHGGRQPEQPAKPEQWGSFPVTSSPAIWPQGNCSSTRVPTTARCTSWKAATSAFTMKTRKPAGCAWRSVNPGSVVGKGLFSTAPRNHRSGGSGLQAVEPHATALFRTGNRQPAIALPS